MSRFQRFRRRLRAPRPDRGHTLVEMMIATALLSVVTTAAFGAVIVMQNQAVATTDRFTAGGEARTIADRITKDIRTAVAPTSTTAAFASASANDVVFYASLADLNTGNGPTRLHAYTSLVPGTSVYVFHEDATQPDVGGTPGNYSYSGAPVNRLDGQYIDTTQPIFTYYNAAGTQILPMPITNNADLRSIDAVGVTLRIRVHPRSPSVVISTRIHVRNVDYNPNN
jgi:prepilin-type N-terminal cleavage/methylation domain-containing protein